MSSRSRHPVTARPRRGMPVLAAVTAAALIAACTPAGTVENSSSAETSAAAPSESRPSPTSTTPAVDPASVAANELGEVPVIMYHRVLPDPPGEYDRSPKEFRDELQYLYDQNYRPVRVIDLVRGEIDLPAGTSPVVLTFDDSSREQFAYDDAGEVAPGTAIGILLEFAERHDGFDAVASLYVNAEPFGGGSDGPAMLADLHARGFELGNHTATHANLAALGEEEVRAELAAGAAVITDAVPEAEVRTLSLPLGMWPEPRELAYRGSADGVTYNHEGVLLVGAEPAASPFSREFDPLAIPRMRSGLWDGGEPDYASGFWLDVLERHPERRYVSDGDPSRVSFPRQLRRQLRRDLRGLANPY